MNSTMHSAMSPTIRRRNAHLAKVCWLCLALLGAPAVSGQAPSPPLELLGPDFQDAGFGEPTRLEAYLDGVVAAQLDERDLAGATVAVVHGGELLFAKGYGWADVETWEPVDPETTLFRIGSVSKLFVWTTVMQLVEEGRLDLHTDINTYLEDFQIPDTYERPVTLAHLMTHTPGFEDWVIGLFGTDENDIRPLGEILSEQLPKRVRPPGEAPSYSNHGTAMAAHVVETVVGKPWVEVVRERVLDPLGMDHTTFLQPLPQPLAEEASKGYRFGGGAFQEQDFEWVPLAPVGSAASTAADMARFMLAHLQEGHLGGRRILAEETARRMREPLIELGPEVNPLVHGFMNLSRGGVRILGHGGDTFWFHSYLALFPEHELGVFVSYNSERGGGAASAFLSLFIERLFPSSPVSAQSGAKDSAARYAGAYRASRYSHTTVAKLAAFLPTRVSRTDAGELRAFGRRFVPVAPGVFEEPDGDWKLVFQEDEEGEVERFYIAHLPILTFERVPFGESLRLHGLLAGVVGLLLLGTLIAWPGGWFVRRWFGVAQPAEERLPKTARGVLWLAALVFVVFTVALAAILSDPNQVALGEVGGLRFLGVLSLVGGLLTLGAGVFTVQAWRRRQGGRLGRIAYTVVTVGLVVFLWQLHVWNLLGFRF